MEQGKTEWTKVFGFEDSKKLLIAWRRWRYSEDGLTETVPKGVFFHIKHH